MTDRFAPDAPLERAAAPDGVRLYAIGDVHGCRQPLRRLLAEIARDVDAAPAAQEVRIVFIGDYIDRGPDSAGVVDDVLALTRDGLPGGRAVRVVTLKGNHEDYLLRFLEGDEQAGLGWMINGGAETLASYDVEAPSARLGAQAVGEAAAAFARALPAAHRAFYEGLALCHEAGGYFFAHAGVRPARPLDAQDPQDLIWIREPFLSDERDFGRVVVHGHTPRERIEERANRIDIDTGAVYGGDLTAACFWGTERRYLQVSS
ncbi:MAG: metallophosphoesterase family protein [Marivibrio sp.]|uniref:metallophosphoesterase family protein n=1 Tax=Marivibrio sp. TaxID=2039719 RepID=UPI0032EE4964